jgi:hypothetical protein
MAFSGVDSARMTELASNIENGEPPEGMPPFELMLLHDPEANRAVAIVIVDSEEDYAKAHEILDSMPTDGTPGSRTSVTKHTVAARMKN